MSRLSPEYVAGLFDGEGSVTSTMNRKTGQIQVRACVAMTDEHIIRLLHIAFGGYFGKQKKYAEHHKDTYAWYVTGNNLVAFLQLVLPHLIVKREEAEVALKLQQALTERGRGNTDKQRNEMFKAKTLELRKKLADIKGIVYASA